MSVLSLAVTEGLINDSFYGVSGSNFWFKEVSWVAYFDFALNTANRARGMVSAQAIIAGKLSLTVLKRGLTSSILSIKLLSSKSWTSLLGCMKYAMIDDKRIRVGPIVL